MHTFPPQSDSCCIPIFIPSEVMGGGGVPVEGEPVFIKWDPVIKLTSQANYVFVRCSLTSTQSAHLIPTSALTSLSALSTHWQQIPKGGA